MEPGNATSESLARQLKKEIETRKATEKALRESEERFQAILDNAPPVIYVKDTQGQYLLINRRYEEVYHVDRAEFIGKTDRDVFPEEVAEALQKNDREVVKSGRSIQFEEVAVQGSVYVTRLSEKFPLRDSKGRVYAVCGISSDITERKKMEEALRESERGVRLINQELEAFTYAVSHDLRAPLRAIDGFSAALLEDYGDHLDEEGKTYLRYLREGSRDMNELINGLLKLSRSTRGEIAREEVDLGLLAKAAIEELSQAEPDRQVAVRIASQAVVEADPRLLRVVMENLIGNAWKYTGKTADACIAFGSLQQDGETVFFVRDNGAGFDMAYADKLFLPFQRLHKTNEFAGTGIGLATVQRIIHRHGGQVWAQSEVGKGATVYFTLGPEGNRHFS
jgi:PAS domain S-box-containing protein